MADTRSAFNPTPGPVVYDDEGRSLAALSHGDVDPSSDVVKAALDTGRLVWSPDTTSTSNRKGS